MIDSITVFHGSNVVVDNPQIMGRFIDLLQSSENESESPLI